MSKLVLNGEQRNAVRSFVRKHSGFDAWRAANGSFASRDFTNELLHKAIDDLDVYPEVMAILGAMESGEMSRHTVVDNAAEDARIESEIAALPGDVDAVTLADTVLNPLRPFLSPVLLGNVESALAPIVMAALKPPVERLVESVITVDASGKPVAPPIVHCQRAGSSTIAKLFGVSAKVKHSDKHMSVWNSTKAPDIDPYFVADVGTLARLISAIDPALPRKPRNVWLAGPAGAGKTTMPEQIAARAKRPFLRIAFQRAVEPADLIGGNGLVAGATVWVDGVLTRAIRQPGTVILLDEITFAPPGLAAALQTLLDNRELQLPTGELVKCADGVTFVLADNTRGFGDESGLYAGTHQANAALVDRMARLIVVGYLDAALEASALANHTGAPKAACERVVAFVNKARKLSGFDSIPLSLRRQVALVEQVFHDGFTPAEAFEDTILSRLPDVDRETIRSCWKLDFDVAAFNAELKGAPVPAAPSPDGAQVQARASFDTVDQN